MEVSLATEVTADAEVVEPKQTRAVAKVEREQDRPPPKPPDLRELSALKFAELCVASGVFKDAADVGKAAVKIKLGYAMGIDEATAMSSIIVVQGRLSFTANFIAARVRQSGKYRYEVKEKSAKKCVLQFFEKIEEFTANGQLIWKWTKTGPPEEFTMEMAQRAGLTKNETWAKYPEAMCFARCLTAGARTYCSDVFCGNAVYTPDELDPAMQVTVDSNGEIVTEAEVEVKKSRPAAAKASASGDGDPIERIKKLAAEMGADLAPYASFYGTDDMRKLKPDQLADMERKLQQKKSAVPK